MKKHRRNPDLIRAGDLVRVVNPEFFLRCGYPSSIAQEAEAILKKNKKEIEDFIRSLFPNFPHSPPLGIEYHEDYSWKGQLPGQVVKGIAHNLGRYKLIMSGFGGQERKIHTEKLEVEEDAIYRVNQTFQVVTGTYEYGRGGYNSYTEEYDYEPPYLSDMKSHRILDISRAIQMQDLTWSSYPLLTLKIEAKNCQKVTEEERALDRRGIEE